MSRRDRPDPLQPAERDLAEALARTASAPGPSPALDAAILAAAREAAAARGTGVPAATAPSPASAARGHRPRHRSAAWLRGGALAATVVLAVGVAWQLRPGFEAAGVGELPEREMRTGTTPADATAPAQAPAPQEAGREPAAAPAPVVVFDAPTPAAPAAAAAAREAAARGAAAAGQDSASSERRARQLPTGKAADAASGAADVPAPPPAPPAPPAPAPPPEPLRTMRAQPASEASAGREAIVPDRVEVTGSRIATPAPRAEGDGGAEAAAGADTGTDADDEEIWFDQPYDDIPPASVDSPAVREAWLARIRELVASERYGEARDSYAEFRRRYPDAPVPDDLRSLLGGG